MLGLGLGLTLTLLKSSSWLSGPFAEQRIKPEGKYVRFYSGAALNLQTTVPRSSFNLTDDYQVRWFGEETVSLPESNRSF